MMVAVVTAMMAVVMPAIVTMMMLAMVLDNGSG